MTTPATFEFEGHDVRIVHEDDEPWFVAADVARVLGYRMASDMTRGLDDDEWGTRPMRTPSGEQLVSVLTEGGLWRAIVTRQTGRMVDAESRVIVKRFQRWITHDVLPAIRKTGSYGSPAAMTFEEMTAHVIEGLSERIAAAEARAKELEAPAAAWTDLAAADGDLTVSDAAKVLSRAGISTGPRKLYDWLEASGWLFRRGGRWQVMQTAINAGLMTERVADYRHPSGERRLADPQPRITPKGLERLRDELASERTLAVVQ